MSKKRTYRVPFTWSDISTYRGELFGASNLSVVLYHYFAIFLNTEAPNTVIRILTKFYNSAVGSVGVDIFIILSGFGLYYSLSRREKLSAFYRKRVYRVVLPYLVCGLVYWIIMDFFFFHETFAKFLLDYTLITFWISEASTFWYISFICLLYILSPFVFWLVNDRRRYLFALICAFSMTILCYRFAYGVFDNIEMALQRVPYFLIGMWLGRRSEEMGDKESDVPLWVICVILFAPIAKLIVGRMDFPLGRSFYGYYGIFLMFAYVMLRKAVPAKWGKLFSLFSLLGKYSLEIYIAHTMVKNIISKLGFSLKNPLIYMMHIIIFIPIVLCISQMGNLKRRCNKQGTGI